MSSGGPYFYASELCRPEWPTAERIFLRLGLHAPLVVGTCGRYGKHEVTTRGRATSWMVGIVLASLVLPDPPEELLAAASAVMAGGHVMVTT